MPFNASDASHDGTACGCDAVAAGSEVLALAVPCTRNSTAPQLHSLLPKAILAADLFVALLAIGSTVPPLPPFPPLPRALKVLVVLMQVTMCERTVAQQSKFDAAADPSWLFWGVSLLCLELYAYGMCCGLFGCCGCCGPFVLVLGSDLC